MINLDFREADRCLSKSRRKIEFSYPAVLLVEFEQGSWNVEPMRRGPCYYMAMEIHLLICCILVTALLSLELYAQFSQISSLSLKLNVPNSAYFFKFLSKRSELFTLLFFIFSLGLLLDFGKLLRSACRLKSSICNSMAVLHRSNSMLEDSHVIVNGDLQLIQDYDNGGSDEICQEDQLFDEMSLRELVKAERQRADMAFMELEKERAAAATAAEEALSMILRLQREKSSVEIEANHCRRLAQQKQHYDQQVIDFLRNLVMEQATVVGGRSRVSLCTHCQLHINDGFGEGEEEEEEEEEDRVTCAMDPERLCYEDGDGEGEDDDDQLLSSLEFDSWSL